uniref:URB1 N-terminal domain-containing protein n=1 Tax=Biomphalaria glabrata TaxID=6526 RepID=A0A2C9LFH0_BIOGL
MLLGCQTHNQLLAHFLDWLVKKIDEEHIADLVTSILCTCPDLIKSVLNSLSPSFSPRWSDKWSKLMDWLAKLYGSIPDKLLTQPDMLYDANAIVSIATVFCLPPPKVAVILQQSVKIEADEGDKQVVTSVAFNFLTELCCSHKYGINFYDKTDPQDVRSCMVLLTLAFLLDSDNAVITVLVQQKTFLQFVIAGLMYDSKEVVVDTLATLMDKVVKCPGVSKTDKIKLFSEVTLKQICELFNWKGPTGWTAGKKSKSQEELVS